MLKVSDNRKVLAEFVGSCILVIASVGSYTKFTVVMENTSNMALLGNAIAVAFILAALIEMLGPISSAHFNPIVTMISYIDKTISKGLAIKYIIVQFMGGIVGVIITHLMFHDYLGYILRIATRERNGFIYFGEFIASFILLLCILFLVKVKSDKTSLMIGLLVGGNIMATSSTNFANPQVTLARVFTDAPSGIRPFDAIVFILMQIVAALLAYALYKFMFKGEKENES